ncbi:MAG: hypothetical protein PHG66_02795, partial [Candidatus Colwellbacteria bacterium]|nr:hypothetical protein [Candidatus Colwellbacteria bacterium]
PEAAATGASSISSSSASLGGLVDANGLSTRYWMEYGPTTSLGYSTGTYDIGSDTYTKSVSQTINGLSSGTTYYYVVKATNSHGTVTSSSRSFATSGSIVTSDDGIPEVTATGTTRISDNSVYLNGVVDPNGNYTEYWFEYGIGNDLSNTTSRNGIGSGTSGSSVSRSISGLSSGTTYKFVVKASNSRGVSTSASYSFTTSSDNGNNNNNNNNGNWGMGWAPIVITNSAQSVSGSSADLVGRVNPNGNYTEYWFEYGIGDSLDKKTTRWHLNPMSGDTAVSTFVGNLNGSTNYKFRLMATNGYGTDSGSLLSFTTTGNSNYSETKPVAVTYVASDIAQNVAILHSRINPRGAATISWFEYGTSASSLDMRTLGQNTGSDYNDRSTSGVITGLRAGTIYYFRVAASNVNGITYGDILSLKTAAGYYRPVITPVKPVVIIDTTDTGTDVAGVEVMLDPSVNRLEPAPGEEIDYTLTYRNAGSAKLSDVAIKVSLPMEVEFIDSSLKTSSRSGNNLTFTIGDVAKNSQGNMIIKVRLKEDVKGGSSVMFNAFMEYNDSSKKFQTIDSYISVVVKGTETDVQSNGFLGSLAGLAKAMSGSWLFIILLFLILIALIYLVITRRRDARNS